MMLRNRARAGALAGVLGLALVTGAAACGSESDGKSETGAAQTERRTPEEEATEQPDGATGTSMDLCAIVTAEDAAAVFGRPAQETEASGPEVSVAGLCFYEPVDDAPENRGLLQLRVYDGDQYYGEAVFPDAAPFDGAGDKGFVNVNEAAGLVDLQFVQDGRTVTINYSSVDVGDSATALEDVARTISNAL